MNHLKWLRFEYVENRSGVIFVLWTIGASVHRVTVRSKQRQHSAGDWPNEAGEVIGTNFENLYA